MFWGLQPLHAIMFAIGTTALAVVLYGFAPRLPASLRAVLRLVCVWLVITSTTLVVMTGETLWHGVAIGGGGLAGIAVIYLAQTRRKPAPETEEKPEAAPVEEPVASE
ncbi:MAG: hypothetical protein ACYDCO_16300 [Armatimonadota bacterium]